MNQLPKGAPTAILIVGAVIFVVAFSIGIFNPTLGLAIFFGSVVIGASLNWWFWHFIF